MKDHLLNLVKIFLVLIFVSSNFYKASAEEEDSILELLQVLQNDIKTLEKAVYSQGSNDSGTLELSSGGNDVLTKHLLKLSDLEEQFNILTNKRICG